MAHVCGCGRSVTGQCDGSHALTEEQWQAKLEGMIREEKELKDELDDDDAREALAELEDFLGELGAKIGIDEDDDYSADCGHCGWEGNAMDVVFKDDEFYCPQCGIMFVPRTDNE